MTFFAIPAGFVRTVARAVLVFGISLEGKMFGIGVPAGLPLIFRFFPQAG
jgi:hypothetical protein